MLSRRTLLATAARGAAVASLGGWSALQATLASAQGAVGATVDLGNGFFVLSTGASNVLAAQIGDGIALVDGGSAAQSAALLQRVAALPKAGKIHTLFNTHWHPEQTGSNETLAKAGATIVAQVNTRLWLTEPVTWPWNSETVQPLPKAALPTKTFFEQDTLTLGGTPLQLGHLRDCPHTDGDMYVFFPQQNVLAIGDTAAAPAAGWPSIDWWTGGWIGGMVGGLDALYNVANDDTKIVPARGPVLTRADLKTQYQMYSAIWERLVKTLYSGGGPAEALAANPTKEFNDIMGQSDEFVTRAFQSLWAYLSPDA